MTATLPAPSTDSGPKFRVRDGDSNWYDHPVTAERFLSVTSALEYLAKPALHQYWTPGLTARAALDELPKLIRATRLQPCGRTNSKCRSGEDGHDWRVRCVECPCDECPVCVYEWLRGRHWDEGQRARERGSAVHHWIRRWILSEGRDDDIEAGGVADYIKSFLRFVQDYGLAPGSWEMSEATVLNRAHMYGGTLDGAIRFDATASKPARELCERFGLARPLLINDWKSREKDEGAFYADMALQLTAYRRGEVVLLDDGTEVPMLPSDGAIVVQLRPNGYDVRPVQTTDEEYEHGFLSILRHARWSIRRGAAVASVYSNDRNEFGVQVLNEEGKPTRVYTFPRKQIPGLDPEPKPAKKTAAAAKAAPRKATAELGVKGTPEAEAAAKEQLIREGLVADPAKAAARKRAAAAAKPARSRASKTAPVQPALSDEQGREFAMVASASGRKAPHPDSPFGDDIPF